MLRARPLAALAVALIVIAAPVGAAVDAAAEAAPPDYPVRVVDPAAVERGRSLYTVNGCAFCHGKDTRGGDGGPSLLRSQIVQRDGKGETIGRIVLNGVPNTAMPSFALKPAEMADVAEFLHSFELNSRDPARRPPRSILTGDAAAGQRFFTTRCATCHAAGDLAGIARRYPDPEKLQQHWLLPEPPPPLGAVVTGRDGLAVAGKVLHIDEFIITIGLADGSERSFERDGAEPHVVLQDPLSGHKRLLRVYSDRNIHDVTAYLATLQRRP